MSSLEALWLLAVCTAGVAVMIHRPGSSARRGASRCRVDQRRDGWLRRPFLWAVLAGAALAVAYPDLSPYVVAGLVLGLVADVVSLRSRASHAGWAKRKRAEAPRSRRRERGRVGATLRFGVIGALGLLALVVAATALFSVEDGDINSSVAPSIEIDGTSTVEIDYIRSTEDLAVNQTLELSREQVAAAAADQAFIRASTPMMGARASRSRAAVRRIRPPRSRRR